MSETTLQIVDHYSKRFESNVESGRVPKLHHKFRGHSARRRRSAELGMKGRGTRRTI